MNEFRCCIAIRNSRSFCIGCAWLTGRWENDKRTVGTHSMDDIHDSRLLPSPSTWGSMSVFFMDISGTNIIITLWKYGCILEEQTGPMQQSACTYIEVSSPVISNPFYKTLQNLLQFRNFDNISYDIQNELQVSWALFTGQWCIIKGHRLVTFNRMYQLSHIS